MNEEIVCDNESAVQVALRRWQTSRSHDLAEMRCVTRQHHAGGAHQTHLEPSCRSNKPARPRRNAHVGCWSWSRPRLIDCLGHLWLEHALDLGLDRSCACFLLIFYLNIVFSHLLCYVRVSCSHIMF